MTCLTAMILGLIIHNARGNDNIKALMNDWLNSVTGMDRCTVLTHGLHLESTHDLNWPQVNSNLDLDFRGAKTLDRYLWSNARCLIVIVELSTVNLERVKVFLESSVRKRVFMLVRDSDDLERLEKATFEHPIIVVQNNVNDQFLIHLVCPKQSLIMNLSLWNPDSGFTRRFSGQECPHPFKNHHLRVSARGLPPFNIYIGSNVTGVDVDLSDILAEKFGFTFEIFVEPFMGMQIANSTEWLGQVGSIRNGTSAFGIGNPALDLARFLAVHFTQIIYTLETRFIAPRPKLSPLYLNIVKPFSWQVWTCLVISVLAVTWTMIIQVESTNVFSKQRKTNLRPRAEIFPFALLMKQDAVEHISRMLVTSPSIRVMVAFWSTMTMLITFAYQCNLRAYLVTTDYAKPIDSVQDVLNMGTDFYIPIGTSLEEMIVTSPQQAYKSLTARAKDRETFFNSHRGWLPSDLELEMLDHGGAFIFPSDPVMMRYKTFQQQFGRQPFRIGSQNEFFFYCGFMVKKHATWKETFDDQLLRLVEMGFIDKLKMEYLPIEVVKDSESLAPGNHQEAAVSSFSFEHVLGAYAALALGLLASLGTFAIERKIKASNVQQ